MLATSICGAIKASGLKVDSTLRDFVVSPAKATDDVSELGEVDLVIVGVKAWQVQEAARAMKPLVGPGTTVLPLQNGVDAVAQLVAELRRAKPALKRPASFECLDQLVDIVFVVEKIGGNANAFGFFRHHDLFLGQCGNHARGVLGCY